MRVTVNTQYGPIGAEYNGGAYIDLSFGDTGPSEVINVWDYATGRATIDPGNPDAIYDTVTAWARDLDGPDGWHGWYGDYVRNA